MWSVSSSSACPVSPAGLADALKPFGDSRMLLPAGCIDRAVFIWEQKYFFGGGWTCVGFCADGVLRAFANYCRHRGHELPPCGVSAQRPSIVCPCHSRTSALDGSMKTAKGFKGTAGFDDSLWSLVELPVTKWHGLAFVDGSGGAGSLAGALAELDELVAPYKPERLVIRGRHTYNAASN
jgi:glycine betaine catabolism A